MASGAGLNRYGPGGGVPFFYANTANGVAQSQPITAASGTFDSGPIAVEAIGFSKWGFQLAQIGAAAVTGYSATIYGTLDPEAYISWQRIISGGAAATINANNWFKLPAPAEQTGTGTSANPITALGTILPYNLSPLVAVRCVLTAAAATGTVQVYAMAIP